MPARHCPFPVVPPLPVPLPAGLPVRVVAAVHFPPESPSVSLGIFEHFQRAVAGRYPVLQQEALAGSGGNAPLWRFTDLADEWRLSLSREFLALETAHSQCRTVFLARFGEALAALPAQLVPAQFNRLGLRYLARISGAPLECLSGLVRPEVLGVGALHAPVAGAYSVTDSLFSLGVGPHASRIHARWGSLGAGSTHDANVLPPVDVPSWVMDLHHFTTVVPGGIAESVSMVEGFASQLDVALRWAVTDEFLSAAQPIASPWACDLARDNRQQAASHGNQPCGSELARDNRQQAATDVWQVREPSAVYAASRESAWAGELVRDTPYELGELRRLTGLTWDALARVFGVSRRAVHLWANGGRMKDANARQLAGLLAQARTERAEKGLPPLASRRGRIEQPDTERRPAAPAQFISVPDEAPRPAGRVISSQRFKAPGKG